MGRHNLEENLANWQGGKFSVKQANVGLNTTQTAGKLSIVAESCVLFFKIWHLVVNCVLCQHELNKSYKIATFCIPFLNSLITKYTNTSLFRNNFDPF